MATQVTAYQAEDGTLFSTQQDAELHENEKRLDTSLSSLASSIRSKENKADISPEGKLIVRLVRYIKNGDISLSQLEALVANLQSYNLVRPNA